MGRHKKPKHSNFIWWIVFIALCVFTCLVWNEYGKDLFSNTTSVTTVTTKKVILTPIDYTTKEIKEEKEKYILAVSYPYFKVDYVDKSIKTFIDLSINEFEKDIQDYEIFNDNKNSLDIFFESYLISTSAISLKFVVSTYTGGAHGNQIITTKNFDLISKREVQLKDLFKNDSYLTYLSQQAIEKFTKSNISNSQWLVDGAGPQYINFKDFTYSADNKSLIFHFDPYQIAPYSSGLLTFEVAKSELVNYLK